MSVIYNLTYKAFQEPQGILSGGNKSSGVMMQRGEAHQYSTTLQTSYSSSLRKPFGRLETTFWRHEILRYDTVKFFLEPLKIIRYAANQVLL